MNSFEAFKILELQPEATEEEIDKAFRKRAAKLHPDVNKDGNAEADFKRLNEAYQLLKHKGPNRQSDFDPVDFHQTFESAFAEQFFNGARGVKFSFRTYGTAVSMRANTTATITFEESILGCIKEVSYERRMPCDECSGKCYIIRSSDKPCQKCQGKGSRTYGEGDKEMPCTSCGGTGHPKEKKICANCNGIGSAPKDFSAKVKIPPGVVDGKSVVLHEHGHYSPAGMRKWADAEVIISVLPDQELSRQGLNVVSIVKISLLEALKGVTKKVRTVKGEKTLKIQPKRKHADQIMAAGLGVPPLGGHVFILDVEYPENLEPLILVLEEQGADISTDTDNGSAFVEE